MLPRGTSSLFPVVMVLLAVSVPISVALDNFLLAMLLLLCALKASRRVVIKAGENPVARAAWLLFGILGIACFYGDTKWGDAIGTLGKYADLAFVPLFMVAAAGARVARLAIFMFMLSMAVTLGLSIFVSIGLLNVQDWMWVGATPDNPAIFHGSITQSVLMGYAVFLALLYIREEATGWKRVALVIFALAGSIDIVFLVIGRTGYLVLLALLVFFALGSLDARLKTKGRRIGWGGAGMILLLASAFAWGAYSASHQMHYRVDQAISEFKAWQPNVAGRVSNETSIGARLEFYYNSLQIIRAHPLLGVGTGGFPQAYAKQVEGTGIVPAVNPHEEYLMLAVQAGLPALLLMLYWLYVQWREAPRLEDAFKRDAARGLVLTIALSCMVNSSLLDHVEGLFFSYLSAILFAGLKRTWNDAYPVDYPDHQE